MRIGIVGQGYVGSAVREVFSKHYETNTFDLNGDCTCRDMEELIDSSDVIFVCVPTPMKKDGSCDTSIVDSVVHELNGLAITRQEANRIIAIKSTIPPGTTNRLNKECEYISVIFNPSHIIFISLANDTLVAKNVFVKYLTISAVIEPVLTIFALGNANEYTCLNFVVDGLSPPIMILF